MALLDATNRTRTGAQFQRENTEPSSWVKSELTAAIAAADQWCEDNAAAFNTALPVAFRTKASTTQKAMLLAFVIMRRNGRLRAEEDG